MRPSYMSPHAVMGSEFIDPEERNRDCRNLGNALSQSAGLFALKEDSPDDAA